MCGPRLLFVVVALHLAPSRALDDLLSARCQANCLANFEDLAQTRGLPKRQLKHTIIRLCKDDLNCSSCAVPCRKPFDSLTHCIDTHCETARSPSDCHKSCEFLDETYASKAGECVRPTITQTTECVTSCGRDGDCAGTHKCCANGCGRTCAPPRAFAAALLPVPVEVSVSERKRGRSAVVRWVMKRLTPAHTRTHSNLYVVQWRWGVRVDEASMTKWQTITVRNKLYAILKHLLSPGRYYKFRVAAVNTHGSMGFSSPSAAFRLSKSPKAPGAPRNLRPTTSRLDARGLVEQELNWHAPDSDLPVVRYHVTWAPVDNESHLPMSDMPRPAALNADGRAAAADDDDADAFEPFQLSKIVSALAPSVVLGSLQPDAHYLVEVQAIVQSEHEELSGEKASVIIRTIGGAASLVDGAASHWTPRTTDGPSTTTLPARVATAPLAAFRNVRVDKPYYQNGLLKATVRWLSDTPNVDAEVTWWTLSCRSLTNSHVALSKPMAAVAQTSSFEMYDLRFGCDYMVRVDADDGSAVRSIRFETPLCRDAPIVGSTRLRCPEEVAGVASAPVSLACSVSREAVAARAGVNVSALCTWSEPARSAQPVIGYRVISGRKMDHYPSDDEHSFPGIERHSVDIRVLKKTHELLLHSLTADTGYVVQVQAISRSGVGDAVRTSFVTPSASLPPRRPNVQQGGMVYNTDSNPELIQNLDRRRSESAAAAATNGRKQLAHGRSTPPSSAASTASSLVCLLVASLPLLVAR